MSTKKKEQSKQKEPQMKLGLNYSGSKLFQFISFRSKRYLHILEQYAYWRSPLVWLLVFLNIALTYGIISFARSTDSLPPQIPLFHYAGQLDVLLFETAMVPFLVFIFVLVQFIVVLISSRVHFKLRDLSQFILAISALATILFFIALYKSIAVTMPTQI